MAVDSPSAGIVKRYSTSDIPKSVNSSRWWSELLHELYFLVDFQSFSDEPYSGVLTTINSGTFMLTDINAAKANLSRKKYHVQQDSTSSYIFMFSLTNGFSATQFGKQNRIQPGDFTLIDSAEPYEFDQYDVARTVVFSVPYGELNDRISDPQALCAQSLGHAEGLSRVASNLMRSLVTESASFSREEFNLVSQQLFNLLSLSILSPDKSSKSDTNVRSAIMRRMRRYILLNVQDWDLTPTKIAQHNGISVRYLHDLFKGYGTTCGDYIRGERLKLSRSLIENPAYRQKSITEIAFNCGFSNSAHFSTSFRAKFGYTPSELRKNL